MERTKVAASTPAKRSGKQFVFWLPEDLAARLDDYRWKMRYPSVKALVAELLAEALAARLSERGASHSDAGKVG